MKKRALIWQAYPSYLLLAVMTIVAVAALGVPAHGPGLAGG